MAQYKGRVKWFAGARGYGFIERLDGGGDVFVHYSGILSSLRFKDLPKEANVEFDIEDGVKGKQAVNVVVI